MISFGGKIQNRQIQTEIKQTGGSQGLVGGRNGGRLPNGYWISFWGDGSV